MIPAKNHELPFPRNALWALGFRPFFLFGALQAVFGIGIWLSFLKGFNILPEYFDPITWHAHEMLFGYAGAIVAGFLLTASQNWTGIPGIRGRQLQFLFFTWLLARILAVIGGPKLLFAIVDLAFWPLFAWCMRPYLLAPGQNRNRVFFAFFGLFAASNAVIHAGALGVLKEWSRSSLLVTLYTLILMISLIGGRVIPFFSSKVITDWKHKPNPRFDIALHAVTALFLFASVVIEFGYFTFCLGLLASSLHFIRWVSWRAWSSRRVPILFILLVGYLWLPLSFAMKSLAAIHLLPPSLAIHFMSVGALGIVVYAMLTRVSLGHTGRPIRSSHVINYAYICIVAAAISRTLAPWAAPQLTSHWIDLSASLWMAAYILFVTVYGRMLISPRADGKPG